MAQYAVLLEFDNDGVLKIFDYICSEFMISQKIRPNIIIGVFKSDRESVMLDFYSGLSQFLEPLTLEFNEVCLFDNGTLYLKPAPSRELNSNYYKTYATMSKHFDAGFDGKFLPSSWRSHVTLGYEPCPEEAQQMLEYLKSVFKPFKCKLTTSALARCEPYQVIARTPLVFDGM